MDFAMKSGFLLLPKVLKRFTVAPYVYPFTFLSRVKPFTTKIDVDSYNLLV